jgi:hypothetical protein
VRLTLSGKPKLRAALAHGLRVKLAGAQRSVRVLGKVGGRTVASGKGRGTVTLRFTRAAAKRLRRARSVRLVVSAGAARTTVTLRR